MLPNEFFNKRLADPFFTPFFGVKDTKTFGAFDVVEAEDLFRVEMDVPGMGLEDFEIAFDRQVLTVKGQKEETKEETGQYLTRRRARRVVEQALKFNTEVDADGIEAVLDEGVLSITVPKQVKTSERKITVRAGQST